MKQYLAVIALAFLLASCGESKKDYTGRLRAEWARVDSIANSSDDFEDAIKHIDQFMADFPEDFEFGNDFFEDAQRQRRHLTYLMDEKNSFEQKEADKKAELDNIRNQYAEGENNLLFKSVVYAFNSYKDCGEGSEPSILSNGKQCFVNNNFKNIIDQWFFNDLFNTIKTSFNKSFFNHDQQYSRYDINEFIKYFDALYLKPGSSVMGFKTDELYNAVQNDVRSAYLAFKLLSNIHDLDEVLERYSYEEEEGDYGYEDEYDNEGDSYQVSYNYYEFYSELYSSYFSENDIVSRYGLDGSYIGSWYRRMMDGTANDLVERLEMILNDYDRKWFNATMQMDEGGSFQIKPLPRSNQPVVELLSPKSGQNETVFLANEALSQPRPVLNYGQEQIVRLSNSKSSYTTSADGEYFYTFYDSVLCYETKSGVLKTALDLDLRKSIYAIDGQPAVSADGTKLLQLVRLENYRSQYLCLVDLTEKTARFRKCDSYSYERVYFIPGTDKIAISKSGQSLISPFSDSADEISSSNSNSIANEILAMHPSMPVAYGTSKWMNLSTGQEKPYNSSYRNSTSSVSADGSYLALENSKNEITILKLSAETGEPAEYLKLEKIRLPIYWLSNADFAYASDEGYKVYSLTDNQIVGKSIAKIYPKHSVNNTIYARIECDDLLIWKPLE